MRQKNLEAMQARDASKAGKKRVHMCVGGERMQRGRFHILQSIPFLCSPAPLLDLLLLLDLEPVVTFAETSQESPHDNLP